VTDTDGKKEANERLNENVHNHLRGKSERSSSKQIGRQQKETQYAQIAEFLRFRLLNPLCKKASHSGGTSIPVIKKGYSIGNSRRRTCIGKLLLSAAQPSSLRVQPKTRSFASLPFGKFAFYDIQVQKEKAGLINYITIVSTLAIFT
jgi:hypothetical protein